MRWRVHDPMILSFASVYRGRALICIDSLIDSGIKMLIALKELRLKQ